MILAITCHCWTVCSFNFEISISDMQTSSIKIECVCDGADECILETTTVGVASSNGGPEQLVIFVVLKEGYNSNAETLKMKFSKAIQSNINPLLKVWYSWFVLNNYELIAVYLLLCENWPDLGWYSSLTLYQE